MFFQCLKGACKKDGDKLFHGILQQDKKVVVQTRFKEEILYNKHCETLEQVAQGSGRCTIPSNISSQTGLIAG